MTSVLSEIVLVAQGMLPSVVAVGIGVFLKNSVANEIDGIVRYIRQLGVSPQIYMHPI